MLNERNIQAFFSLLRAGLWHRPIDKPDCFPLEAEDWEKVYQDAVRHTVEGILFDGIEQLSQVLQPPMQQLLKWLVRVEKIKQRNTWMNGLLKEQMLFFESYGLKPILLKGQGVAQCYPDPARRICGDIDWYFNEPNSFREANKLLLEKGIDVVSQPGYTSGYQWKGCMVDQHRRLLDLHNPLVKRDLRKLEMEQQAYAVSLRLDDQTRITLPSPVLQVIQVNVHILKHMLSFGVGLRQLCDAACLYHYYAKQLDGHLLDTMFRKLGIEQWTQLLHQVLVDFLGLDPCLLPFPLTRARAADWVMADSWTAGNFGFSNGAYVRQVDGEFVGRRATLKRITGNIWKYFPYAPMEAICFPIVHFYSRFGKA